MALTLSEMRDRVKANAKVQGNALNDIINDFLNRVWYMIARQRRNQNLLITTDIEGSAGAASGDAVNLPNDFLVEDRLLWLGDGAVSTNRLLPKSDQLVIPLSDLDVPTQYQILGDATTQIPFTLNVFPFTLFASANYIRMWYYKIPARLADGDTIPWDVYEEEMMIKAEAMVYNYFGNVNQANQTMSMLPSNNQDLPAQ